MSAYPAPNSPLYPIACDFVNTANTKDLNHLETLLAPSFIDLLHPRSLQLNGHNQRTTREDYLAKAKANFETNVDYFGMDVDHPVNVVEAKDCIVLQLVAHGKLKSGRDWNVEYLYIIRFNEEQKIVKVDMWLDSAAAQKAYSDTETLKFDAGGRIAATEKQ